MKDLDHYDGTDQFIAVIGMAGRFPGAATIDEFWDNLAAGRDTVTRAPGPPAVADGDEPRYVPALGMLTDAEWFDADYFGYPAKDALVIDPQHRVFLECSVAALEDAGQDPGRFPGSIGVYGGCAETQYAQALLARRAQLAAVSEDDILLGTAPDFLVARVAERLGCRGPAIGVQAACATALVAIHVAGRGLLAGDCDMALAGSAAVHVPPKRITWSKDGTLAPDGVCRAFDAGAAGTVASNGVGVVVLKLLSRAVADGDRIRAVVRGSAVTNDGSARVGFAAPSVAGQAAAVREAQAAAGTDPRTISYVEAHGTGTPLGDPIEVAALTEAFGEAAGDKGFCAIGSVKTNIGHADAAAGAAGFIKTVLALEHGLIPPSLHYTEPNPRIDMESSPFRVATTLTEWQPDRGVRRAGVSSFAVGGVNAHLVVEEAPRQVTADSARPVHLLVHSAVTRSALLASVRRVADHVREQPGQPVADIAWTLQHGRREHRHRAITLVTADRRIIAEPAAARPLCPPADGQRPHQVAFLFSGMAGLEEIRQLRSTEPAFRAAFGACLDALGGGAAGGGELASAVRDLADGTRRDAGRPGSPEYDVCAFAAEYGLAMLWQRWGITPAVVAGTTGGTLAAAVVAGALSLRQALRLVTARSRHDAGSPEPGEIAELVRESAARPLRIPMVLASDGRCREAGGTLDPGQWLRELDGPAASDRVLSTLLAAPGRLVLWVGRGPVPSVSPVSPVAGGAAGRVLAGLRDPARSTPGGALACLYAALGELWVSGVPVSWEGVHEGEDRHKVPLPGYPFERLPYLLREPVDQAAWISGAREPTAAPGSPAPPEPAAAAGERRAVTASAPATAAEPASAGTAASAGTGEPGEGTPLRLVLRLFAEALGMEEVDPEENFFELGGDSLVGAKVLAEVKEAYSLEVEAQSLFTARTAHAFADLIEQELSARKRAGAPGDPS